MLKFLLVDGHFYARRGSAVSRDLLANLGVCRPLSSKSWRLQCIDCRRFERRCILFEEWPLCQPPLPEGGAQYLGFQNCGCQSKGPPYCNGPRHPLPAHATARMPLPLSGSSAATGTDRTLRTGLLPRRSADAQIPIVTSALELLRRFEMKYCG